MEDSKEFKQRETQEEKNMSEYMVMSYYLLFYFWVEKVFSCLKKHFQSVTFVSYLYFTEHLRTIVNDLYIYRISWKFYKILASFTYLWLDLK